LGIALTFAFEISRGQIVEVIAVIEISHALVTIRAMAVRRVEEGRSLAMTSRATDGKPFSRHAQTELLALQATSSSATGRQIPRPAADVLFSFERVVDAVARAQEPSSVDSHDWSI
jgi:hypothetical protein